MRRPLPAPSPVPEQCALFDRQGPWPCSQGRATAPEVAVMRPLANSVRKGAAAVAAITASGGSASGVLQESAATSVFGGQGSAAVTAAPAHVGLGSVAASQQQGQQSVAFSFSAASSSGFHSAASASQASSFGAFNPTAASTSSAGSLGTGRPRASSPSAALAAVQQQAELPPQRARRAAPLALSTVPELPLTASHAAEVGVCRVNSRLVSTFSISRQVPDSWRSEIWRLQCTVASLRLVGFWAHRQK